MTESFTARIKALGGPPKPATPSDQFDTPKQYQAGNGKGYAHKALDNEIENVLTARKPTATSGGGRNEALNKAAFSLGQLVAGGELDEPTVVRELTAAARLAGLDEHEIQPTIESGLRAGGLQPRNVPERPGVPAVTDTWNGDSPASAVVDGDAVEDAEPVEAEDERLERIRQHFPRLDWQALWDDEDDEDWIVEPILPARRLVAIYSPPKVGKSLLMLEIAVGIARAVQVLGVTPDRPRRVLYIDFENDPKGDIRERLKAMGEKPQNLDNLVYLSFPTMAALDSAQGGHELMAAVQAYSCEVVVIDTVSRAVAGEENENDTWLAFYRHTGRALKAAGIALIRLDHTGKDETKGQRGGSAKSGDVDAVWRLSKVTETTFQLTCEANRLPITEKTLVLHRETSPRLWHRVDASGRAGAWRERVAEVVRTLDDAGLDNSAGRDRALEVLRGAGIRVRKEVVEEAIRMRKGSIPMSAGPAP